MARVGAAAAAHSREKGGAFELAVALLGEPRANGRLATAVNFGGVAACGKPIVDSDLQQPPDQSVDRDGSKLR